MSSALILSLTVAVALPAIAAGLALFWSRRWALPRGLSSLSGGLLAGMALFVVLPDAWSEAGAVGTLGPLAAGLMTILLVDRYVHPVCPECSGREDWWSMAPLWAALAAHSLLDGALTELARPGSMASWALLAHRVPEALATVALLKTAQPGSKWVGVQMLMLQVATLIGFGGASWLDARVLHQGSAFAGGALLFLGFHRLHRSWQEAELRWTYTVVGAVGVWMVRHGHHFFSAR